MPRRRNEVQQLTRMFIRGSVELGEVTGITDKETHREWRENGLPHLVMKDGSFLYEPAEVQKFIRKYYAPPTVNIRIRN